MRSASTCTDPAEPMYCFATDTWPWSPYHSDLSMNQQIKSKKSCCKRVACCYYFYYVIVVCVITITTHFNLFGKSGNALLSVIPSIVAVIFSCAWLQRLANRKSVQLHLESTRAVLFLVSSFLILGFSVGCVAIKINEFTKQSNVYMFVWTAVIVPFTDEMLKLCAVLTAFEILSLCHSNAIEEKHYYQLLMASIGIGGMCSTSMLIC